MLKNRVVLNLISISGNPLGAWGKKRRGGEVSSSGSLFADGPLNGVLNQLAGVSQRKLVFNMSLVRLDCLHAEMELFGNLASSVSLSDQAKNLEFTICKLSHG